MPKLVNTKAGRLIGIGTATGAILGVVFLGVFTLTNSFAASGTTYTVSAGASLSTAVSKLQPGDTLIVGNGAYSGTLSASPSGTLTAPITIKAAAGANPVLTGLVRLSGANYVTWDNIDVKWPSSATSADHMFKMTDGTGWRVTNSDIGGAHSYAGILVAGTPSKWSIDHNIIHDTYQSNDINQDHLIYVNGGTGGGTIERNIFTNSANGRGVKIGPPSSSSSPIGNVIIRYNTFYNNTGPSNIQLSYGASGNTIYRNIMVKSGGANITAFNLNGTGNKAYDNIGWDSTKVGEFGGGLSDGGGNQHVDPSLSTTTWQVASAYASYGRYAPGDTITPPPPPSPDTTPPTTAVLTAPTSGQSFTIGTSVALTGTGTDNVGVVRMEFYDGTTWLGTDSTGPGPFTLAWNTTGLSAGTHGLSVLAFDAAGLSKSSAVVSVTLSGGTAILPGDVNGDSRVNALDLSALISHDGQNYAAADFNKDGSVGAADMAILLGKWTW
jgi:hypothetical protein